jgi:hypothetical protein
MCKFCLKKAVLTVVMLLGPVTGWATEIKGCFKLKNSLARVPEFRILFRGKETVSNSEGFFSIPLDEPSHLDNFYLLVCENVQQHFEKKTNTLKDMGMQSKRNYRCFNFSHFGSVWMRNEVHRTPSTIDLQERCVVVLLDPKNLDGIEPWEIDFPGNIIKLPQLVLKPGLTTQKLARESARSLLNSLDETTFLEPVKEEAQKLPNNPKVKVTLAR